MNEKINLGIFEFDGDRIQRELAKTKSEIDQLGTTLSDVRKQSKAYSREIVDLAKEQAKLKEEGKEGTEEFKRNAQQLERLQKKHKDVTSSIIELEKNQKSLKQEYRDGLKILQSFAKAQDINVDNYKTEGKSIRELRREGQALTTLRNEMKTVVGEESEEIKKLNAIIEQNTQAQKSNVNENQKRFYQIGQYKEELSGSFTEIKNSIDALRGGDFVGFAQGVKGGFAGMTAAARTFFVTLLSNPITAVVAVLAALVVATAAVVREFWNYNEAIRPAMLLTQQITKLQGEQADQARNLATAYTESFGGEFKENLQTARELVEDFGISYVEAFELMQEANIKGANQNEELNDTIREYGGLLADAGYSAQEFIDIVNAGVDLGIYKDKLPDAIKEAQISLKEATPATRAALVNAFGAPFTNELLDNVKKGTISVKDALNEIAEESENANLNQQQLAQLTADLFRGAGEDAGGAVKIFEALTYAIDGTGKELTELQQHTLEVANAQNELQAAKDAALKSDSIIQFQQDWELAWIQIKTGWYNGINAIGDFLGQIETWGASTGGEIRGTFLQIPSSAIKAFGLIKDAFVELLDNMQSGGDVIESLFNLDYDGARANFRKFKNGFSDFAEDIKNINKQFQQELKDAGEAESEEALKQIEERREKARKIAEQQAAEAQANAITGKTTGSSSPSVKNAGKALEQAQKDAQKAIEETNRALAEQAEISARLAENELTQWIADNASKIDDNARLNDELLAQELQRLDELEHQQNLAREKEREAKEFKIQQEIDALEAKKSLSDAELIELENLNNEKKILNDEFAREELEQAQIIEDKKSELKEQKRLQDAEDEKLRRAIEFEEKLINLENENATEFELRQELLDQNYEIEQEKLADQRAQGLINEENYQAALANLKAKYVQDTEEIEKAKNQAIVNDYASTFGQIANIMEEGTAAWKAFAIAQAVMTGYSSVLNTFDTASASPIATLFPAYPFIRAAIAGAFAVKQVQKIASTPKKKAAKGITLSGSSHAEGGIDLYDGQGNHIVEAEGDENVYVLNKRASRQINALSSLNQTYGGIPLSTPTNYAERGGYLPTNRVDLGAVAVNNNMSMQFGQILSKVGDEMANKVANSAYHGIQKGTVDLSTNQQIAKGANHG